MEAVLIIDQSDIEFVKEGDPVEIKLDEFPGDIFPGETTIDTIAHESLKASPRSMSTKAGGEVATITDAGGQERPQSTSYQARVFLQDTKGELRISLRGRAKIHTRWQTLGQRLWRFASRTFHFQS